MLETYEWLSSLLPCLLCFFFLLGRRKPQNGLARHTLWMLIFWFYLCLAVSASGLGTVWDIGYYETMIRPEQINLLPFSSAGLMTYALNVLMFLPLGFLLPLLWPEYRRFLPVLCAAFCFSLMIECGQLFNMRKSDVDDLLMNTLGAVLGYLLWLLLKQVFPRAGARALSLSRWEAPLYLLLAVLGRFLLYNWRLLV